MAQVRTNNSTAREALAATLEKSIQDTKPYTILNGDTSLHKVNGNTIQVWSDTIFGTGSIILTGGTTFADGTTIVPQGTYYYPFEAIQLVSGYVTLYRG